MADWSRYFDEPIPLPDGNSLRTLIDAGRFIDALPKAKYQRQEWRTATELLLMAADGRTPLIFAQAAFLRALTT